ncbi:MAG: RimK family alpha-L-glutamate ligase [Desulfobacteraceae bacterium]
MILSLHPLILADRQIILGPRPVDQALGEEIERADAVILPQTCSEDLYRAAGLGGAAVFPNYGPRFAYPGKSGQARMFAHWGFPHPETKCWSCVGMLRSWTETWRRLPHEPPFVVKSDFSHEGEGVWLVEDGETMEESLRVLEVKERSGVGGFVTQSMIPSAGNALRAVILEKRVYTYWKRAPEGEVLATISRGARVDQIWRPDLQAEGGDAAIRLRERLGINLAAVDMVFDLTEPEPSPVLLEVNYSFGRRGLGGGDRYYRLLLRAVRDWLRMEGFDPRRVGLCC